MKLEGIPDLYFVITVLVPGFIYYAVLSKLVPIRRSQTTEVVILGFLTATAFNYAICSPLIYLLVTGRLFPASPGWQAITWLGIAFLAPIALALASAKVVQEGWLKQVFAGIGLRSIDPIPTGWDWFFSRTEPCYVLVTLLGGTQIAGYFGADSIASSDPERRDLYLECVYTIPASGPWAPVAQSYGVFIEGSQIAFMEFSK